MLINNKSQTRTEEQWVSCEPIVTHTSVRVRRTDLVLDSGPAKADAALLLPWAAYVSGYGEKRRLSGAQAGPLSNNAPPINTAAPSGGTTPLHPRFEQ